MTSTAEPEPGDPVAVVDALREAIAEGDFAPNQRLVEADLSEQFGASRSAGDLLGYSERNRELIAHDPPAGQPAVPAGSRARSSG